MKGDSRIKAAMWEAIKTWFEEDCGIDRATAGKMVGKWNRDHGFLKMATAVIDCEMRRNKTGEPADPIPWIQKYLGPGKEQQLDERTKDTREVGFVNIAGIIRSAAGPYMATRRQQEKYREMLPELIKRGLLTEEQAQPWR